MPLNSPMKLVSGEGGKRGNVGKYDSTRKEKTLEIGSRGIGESQWGGSSKLGGNKTSKWVWKPPMDKVYIGWGSKGE